jgi:serine/threonine-protein kinase
MSELCSLCQVVEAGPYCPEHGRVHRPFTIAGRYDVDELIGARAASFVFGAHDRKSGRAVAVRVVSSQLTSSEVAEICEVQQRYLRQLAAWGEAPDQRAVGIVDFGWDEALAVSYLVACRAGAEALRPTLQEVEATLLSLDTSVTASMTMWVAPGARPGAARPAVADTDPLDMPAMIGSYRVVRELGSGGTGRVYLGQHPVIGSKVAIKVLLPEIARSTETVERFIQEARASSQIGSPHIPRYFDFGTTPSGLPYAIMEYFDGETLGERLSRTGPLTVGETAQILEQVASALLMAHDAGLVHRDLKPDNLLLVKPDGETGRTVSGRTASPGSGGSLGPGAVKSAIGVKVLDFGIAKMVGNRSATRTLSGSFLGTPSHCAPEQVFGHEVDARTDVYSLGATAFQMLTGAPPFVGGVPEILSLKATEDAPDLAGAGVPAVVAHTIRHMLAREPRHRAPSMAWVLEQLASWPQEGEPGAAARVRVAARLGAATITAEHHTAPDVRPDDRTHDRPGDDEVDDPAVFGRAGTATATSKDLDPATTSQARPALARRPGRSRWRTALVLTGGALAVAAVIVLLGVPLLRSTPPASSWPDVQAAPTGSGTARAVPPTPAPLEPRDRAHDATAPVPVGGSAAPAEAPPQSTAHAEGAGSDAGAVSATPYPPGGPAHGGQSASSPDVPPASGRTVARHWAAKPPPDKKPPAKKPPAKRPPGDPKDVLIVDPFSHGTSPPRSDSP